MQTVEERYFKKEGFVVDVHNFNKAQVARLYDGYEMRSDQVDESLHFGIKARFNKYLDAMSDLRLVDDVVVKQLDSIALIRATNKELQSSMAIIKHKIVAKVKRAAKKKAVLEILQNFETINKSLNKIDEQLKDNLFNDAVGLYKKQEELLYNKLKGYCLTDKFQQRLDRTRLAMIEQVGAFFKTTLSGYLIETLLFTKKKGESGEPSRLLHEMTLIANSSMNMSMDISILERYEHNSVPLYLLNNFEAAKKEEIDFLAVVLSNYLSIKDFKVEGVEEPVSKEVRIRVGEVKI